MAPLDQASPRARIPTWSSLALQHSINKMRMIYNYICSSYFSTYKAKNVEFDRFDSKFCSFLTSIKAKTHGIQIFNLYYLFHTYPLSDVVLNILKSSKFIGNSLGLLISSYIKNSKYTYIYIYIYIERERERERNIFLPIPYITLLSCVWI